MTIDIDNDVPMPEPAEREPELTQAQRINAMYIDGMAPLTIAAKLKLTLAQVRPHCHYGR